MMSSENKDSFLSSFPFFIFFILSSCSIVLARSFNTMLLVNGTGEKGLDVDWNKAYRV